MHLLIDVSTECERLAKESSALSKQLIQDAEIATRPLDWPASADLAKSFWGQREIYILKDGIVRFSLGGQLFMLLEEGDLIGLDLHRNLQGAVFSSDFPIKVEGCSLSRFLEKVMGVPKLTLGWSDFLAKQARLFLQLNASMLKVGLQPETRLQMFEKGDKIIEQGSASTQVYHLVEGTADVLVDRIKVGEIKEDSIFGIMAALTKTPRSASVVATAECSVMVLEEDQFMDLVRSKPESFLKLCKDMSETILDLNKKVVDLSKGKAKWF